MAFTIQYQNNASIAHPFTVAINTHAPLQNGYTLKLAQMARPPTAPDCMYYTVSVVQLAICKEETDHTRT